LAIEEKLSSATRQKTNIDKEIRILTPVKAGNELGCIERGTQAGSSFNSVCANGLSVKREMKS
jgi:hypothetical protein